MSTFRNQFVLLPFKQLLMTFYDFVTFEVLDIR